MNRELFDLYVKTKLAPTLQPGDVIILPSHRCKQRLPGNGQLVIAQKPRRGSSDEGRRPVVSVPSAL
jgi:hypothetical protein